MRAFFAVFTAILAFVQVAAAIPPACLLAALGVQENPSDLKAVCGDLQHAIQGNLTSNCHKDVLPEAYKVYSSKCLEQGVTVAKLPTSSTSSAHSSTGTSTASATGSNSVSASATPTSDSTVNNSGESGSDSATSSTESGSTSVPTGNAGMATEPKPFLFAAAALFATGLTSVIFL
ncbi:hypothetical protein F4774DRAFT_408033 [Daldinia eschscholtzii]|nr:hypothetical protein F4774DRAFT_408033 [Daldinia eschscholtzii]